MLDANIPQVVKTFMWKACCNILTNRQNLNMKNVLQEVHSPICELEEDYVEHLLWKCPSTNDVWSIVVGRLKKCSLVGLSFNGHCHAFGLCFRDYRVE